MAFGRAKRVVLTVYNDLDKKFLVSFGAALSFYFLLSLFPLLIFLASLFTYLPIPNLFDQTLALLSRAMPEEAMGAVELVLADILQEERGGLLSIGILAAIWTASLGFHSMFEALNVIYEVPEGRPYWRRRLIAIGMTFGVGVLVASALTVMILGPQFGSWLAHWVGLSPVWAAVWPYLRWTIVIAFTVLAVELIYFIGPNVRQRFFHQLPGAVFAVFAWILASYALGWYFRSFADFSATYGVLGAAVGLMMWFFVSATVILMGAEFNHALLKTAGERLPPKETEAETPVEVEKASGPAASQERERRAEDEEAA